jgi:hypothetical protein
MSTNLTQAPGDSWALVLVVGLACPQARLSASELETSVALAAAGDSLAQLSPLAVLARRRQAQAQRRQMAVTPALGRGEDPTMCILGSRHEFIA